MLVTKHEFGNFDSKSTLKNAKRKSKEYLRKHEKFKKRKKI